MTHNEKLKVIHAMKNYGGGFVKQLAYLWLLADDDNCERIEAAWPEYIAKYRQIGIEAAKEPPGDEYEERIISARHP
jgi:hypothetical protein